MAGIPIVGAHEEASCLCSTRGDLVVAGSCVHTRGPRDGVLPRSGGFVCPHEGADGRL